ncbi:radial spoke head 10 homolog B [Hyla sarda]|uniref:radial spoke head 10 homolog B n=1 Tax=Hyla sarda TaxID=327740 RepID=UPI0024C2ECDD|nr:radial spoke head 10 homolog B [Hyla sarda]XP_056392007.1 radial spoke head 10 homolog B [Hyla sarda]
MGKMKKKDGKKSEKSSVEVVDDASSKFSSVSVSPTEEHAPAAFKPSDDEPVAQEEPPAPFSPLEVYEEPVLAQLIVEKYEGELLNGLYEGEGVAYYKDGNVYRGHFSEGLMHGKGEYIWADGLKYEGEFFMNFPMGHGLYTWPNGSRYEGQVYKGIRHGSGVHISSGQQVSYAGEWNMGRRHGKGAIYYNAEGTSWYEGDWIHNRKEGWGVQRFPSGNIYEGQWKNNKFHGEGRMRWLSSNEEYMGLWENGIQNGLGTHTWFLKRVSGSQYSLRNEYIGNFVNGARHGQGQFYYANGAMYDGQWENNKKHGIGKFIFKNGRIYIGDFVEDQIAEYPNFKYDRVNTPDLSGIRTQSPICGEISTLNSGIPSLAGSYIELDIASLLNTLPENERFEEQKQVEYGILRNLTMLRKTYKSYSSLGNENCCDNAFLMTKLQFWRFLKDCKFHHYGLTLCDMDRILADHSDPEEIHSPYASMLLRTFLTNIIYLADHIARADCPDKKLSLVDCFSKIMTCNIVPHGTKIKGHLFSDAQKTEHAMSYIDKCWDIYKTYCKKNTSAPFEPTMTMRHFIWMMRDLGVLNKELSVTKIVDVLAEDDPSVREGNEIILELELTFLEFLEALIGCAITYVTDELLQESNHNLLQGEQRSNTASDGSASADLTNHRSSLSTPRKSDSGTEEKEMSIALKVNEKRSPRLLFPSSKKTPKKIMTDRWFCQVDVFFHKVFFLAYEKAEELKAEIPKNRARQAEQARLQRIWEEEETRLKALRAEEEAKRLEQMEIERAAAMLEAGQVSDDQADDHKSRQDPAANKEEAPIPPSTASTKATTATSKKKKK